MRISGGPAHDFLLARHVHGIVLAAAGLAQDELRDAFLEWVIKVIRDDHGLCTLCGQSKDQAQFACADCLAELLKMDEDLGLTDVAQELRDLHKGAEG